MGSHAGINGFISSSPLQNTDVLSHDLDLSRQCGERDRKALDPYLTVVLNGRGEKEGRFVPYQKLSFGSDSLFFCGIGETQAIYWSMDYLRCCSFLEILWPLLRKILFHVAFLISR